MACRIAAAVGGSPHAPKSTSSPRLACGCSSRERCEQLTAGEAVHPLRGEHDRDGFAVARKVFEPSGGIFGRVRDDDAVVDFITP